MRLGRMGLGAALVVALTAPAAVCAREDTPHAIAALLATPGGLVVDGVELDGAVLRIVYEPRTYAPVWTDRARARAVLDVLAVAGREGLDPTTYHVEQLGRRLVDGAAQDAASLDLLLTDAVVYYATHVQHGALAPRHTTADVGYAATPVDPVAIVTAVAGAPDVREHLAGLAPRHPGYVRLREALAREREAGGSGTAGAGVVLRRTLRPGDVDIAVADLREYLLPGDRENRTAVYDPALVAAVKAYQREHRLAPDGVLGPRTRAALAGGEGLTREERIDAILGNMERWRWLPADLGRRHVLVNIPTFTLDLIEDGVVTLSMPVVVGKPKRATPVLSAEIRQLVFNPPWHVPRKLVREDVWPKIARNPGYASARGIAIGGLPRGEDGAVDWGAPGLGRQVSLRQAPGPQNPLGRVKFHMPNPYAVYLHDTNSKALLRRDDRAQSSGCIRLGDALALAERLLPASADVAPAERMKRYTRTWKTQWVSLPEPVPVHLVYATAWVDADGRLGFTEDLYGRDLWIARAREDQRRLARDGRKTPVSLARGPEPVYQAPSAAPDAAGAESTSREDVWLGVREADGTRSAAVGTSSGSGAH